MLTVVSEDTYSSLNFPNDDHKGEKKYTWFSKPLAYLHLAMFDVARIFPLEFVVFDTAF